MVFDGFIIMEDGRMITRAFDSQEIKSNAQSQLYTYDRVSVPDPTKSKKYYMMSHGKNQKWNHNRLIEKIRQYYPDGSATVHSHYPYGFECGIGSGDNIIYFELNKRDKTIGIVGENRKKLQNYPKNGYIVTLPNNVSQKLLAEIEAVLVE